MPIEFAPGGYEVDPGDLPAGNREALRRLLIDRRKALPASDWARQSATIRARIGEAFPRFAHLRVGFCWPIRQEPDLRPLLLTWLEAGHDGFAPLLPLVVEDCGPLAFRVWTPGAPMSTDRHGIPTPASGALLTPEVLLIPVNAFDAAGNRIGYGGGYFDRTLASLSPRPFAVGVGFELNRVAAIAREAHDQPLDVMVTEAGVFWPVR
ncbi:5-formyltetrahydrofolate cyclo-ligase [Accumulibacter sp.]|uniref:5-formyltetrahydrofolate cyclo-ligase n=1 Tax=Accumulibacter sp. TaxID=2053492 RepID=UPI0025D89F62|nr:5-formyltetrahydrofolate cyclo-ligase [Accumulibacter sp.]MCM8595333.1 5-formyltetrahydrofolate cyclo-ligase [Accumulibacter sp.]MCM8625288.1 5-formyltetrahydrofolate cyclo-ligase [Accumulibacter sp.]MDS4049480.1 5-formyltetrahydrofolate cyclo-ligase [Accumulibacter sp.]